MIPTEGLIASYRGQMLITLILLVLGAVACTALTIAVMVRKAPPLTTQVNLMTGVREHGIGRWFLGFASFTIAPPLLFGVVRTLIAALDWLNLHAPLWWVLGMLLAVCGGCVWVLRRFRVPRREYHDEPAPAAEPEPEPVPPEMWRVPEGTPQWDSR